MQTMNSTLPPHMFQTKNTTFTCRASSINNHLPPISPPRKPLSSSTTTKLHLSNLDKLLQKQSPIQTNDTTTTTTTITEKKSKNILEGLDLSNLIWSDKKTTDDQMSPHHLKNLQHLLTKTAEYSPRNTLGSHWRQYHGCNDWKGMLDPLDENLRREVVRYGEFVQAAYHCFHSDPATSQYEPPQSRHVSLPDKSYRVTKNLYATSSIGLPKWVDDVAPDLGWMSQRSSWIGYVAVCDDKREISRLGRRDIVISLRGTATCLEWAENMRAHLIETNAQHGKNSKVGCGFLSLYKTKGTHVPSLAESVIEEVKRLMEVYKGETLSVTVTGHSLGAALALLVADDLSTCSLNAPPVAVFSFGGPKVGNKAYGNKITSQNVKVLRIVNSQDVITRVPGIFVSEEFEQKLRNFKAVSENTPLAYSHVGVELRVDTKMSPFLKPDADMACCHDLEAYLHLVDGFLASNCPFRANAKRSLARLMQDQSSNVKKLYTSKAKTMSVNIEKQRTFSISDCLPSPS
ncbi:unnamed protein product [Trifolium pratense]|uniref:Uncharacterized protein n=1 Tax=Trifolium pratense TaxID=57577 RepID=A0ACB0L3S5_TRIPR|nr:unnamed protein product [Trifolium pratense]